MPESWRQAKSVGPTVIWQGKQERNLQKKAYQVLNSLLGPEWVTAKGPECAKIGVRIWVGEKAPDKEAKDKVSSNTLGCLLVIGFTGALGDPGCSAAQVCEHLVRGGSQTKHKTMTFRKHQYEINGRSIG